MPRPWSCRVHGVAAPTHWTRNGSNPRARRRRQRCSRCHPPKGPTIEGLTECPRCGRSDVMTVHLSSGRSYRRCRPCTRASEHRWKVRMGLAEVPDDWPIDMDPWVQNLAALEEARRG